jgi:3-oxoacyl-[acyl-carrier protein] reductase
MGDWILHPEYCAANAGVVGLTRAVAIELFPYNITCNAFDPFAGTRASVDLEAAASLEDNSRLFAKGFVAPSVANSPPPEAIAPFLTWLCTDSASRISGSIFSVTGNSIGLYSDPGIKHSVVKFSPEFWTNDELERQIPRALLQGYSSIADPKKVH